MFAPGLEQVMREFRFTNSSLASFVVSVYILGYAVGPLFMAPLSELYGRLPVYHVSNALFVVFTIACAVSSNLGMLVAFRFLDGCVGSTPLVLGGGTIADLISQEKRGGIMAVWAIGPLLGPAVGPIAGGYVAENLGWRWVFWIIAIVVGVYVFVDAAFHANGHPGWRCGRGRLVPPA
jgi:multidrug resistance protein